MPQFGFSSGFGVVRSKVGIHFKRIRIQPNFRIRIWAGWYFLFRSFVLSTLFTLLVGGLARGQEISFSIYGDASGDLFGKVVSGAGDVNGDGYPDLLIAAPSGIHLASYVRIISGISGSEIRTLIGGSPNFGVSVDGIGDVNLDGFGDIAVGVTGDSSAGNQAGAVEVFSGADGSLIWKVLGLNPEDQYGMALSNVGDIDGDGISEIIVGARGNYGPGSQLSGYAHILSGIDGSILLEFSGISPDDRFGQSVAGAGDVDGDGIPDVIVGADFDSSTFPFAGAARVFSGANGGIIHTLFGSAPYDFFGKSVAAAGDLNGDGRGELLIGAFQSDSLYGSWTGSVSVISGANGAILNVQPGNSPYGGFGIDVCSVGDTSGDGVPDYLVGGSEGTLPYNPGPGYARLFSGSDHSVLRTFYGAMPFDFFGHSVTGIGDVNFDGLNDILIGAYGDDTNGDLAGRAIGFSLVIQPYLVLSDLLAGHSASFSVVNFEPNTPSYLVYSFDGLGRYFVQSLNVELGLSNPVLGAGPKDADATGTATWTADIPRYLQGVLVWFQAIQRGRISNVVQTVVQ